TVGNFASSQIQEEQAEHEIKPHKANQGENRVAVAYHFAVAIAGVKQTIDEPWLTSQFRGHPAQNVGDVGVGKGQQQNPQHPVGGVQLPPPTLKTGNGHQSNEDRPQRDHQVKRVIQELNVVRP